MHKSWRKRLLRLLLYTFIFTQIGMASVFVINEIVPFTSANSAIYVVRGRTGGFEIKRDLFVEDSDRLIFMVDLNGIMGRLHRELAVATNKPRLEVTWDDDEGVGGVKQFRPDGSMLSFCFSRSSDVEGWPRGLFLGGDLPYGDESRDSEQASSGFGYYDERGWHHIWCSSNEAFKLSGGLRTVVPPQWDFIGSRVLKRSAEEVVIESEHEAVVEGKKVRMQRMAYFRAGEDYFILKVRFTNMTDEPIMYGYSWGDEPWVGRYGGSEGDVGWYDEGLIGNEMLISPVRHRFAGYWDRGNASAREGSGYSGYANFVEWSSPLPTLAFMSNAIDKCCDESAPLMSETDRVISLVWLNQLLLPWESRTHTLALGIATDIGPDGLPLKPEVAFR